MSKWTSLNASIRFGGLPNIDEPPNLGIRYQPELYNKHSNQSDKQWRKHLKLELDKRRACNIPCGSEGSLHHNMWINPECSTAMFMATIWGDLRDYDDVWEIRSYLDRIVLGYEIISGIAEIHSHNTTLVLQFSYKHDDKGKWETLTEKNNEN